MKKDTKQPKGFIEALMGEPTPSKRAGLLYSLLAFVFFGVSLLLSMLQGDDTAQWYLYCAYLAAPCAFAILAVWYFSRAEGGFKGFLKEQKCSPKYYLLAITMQLGLFSLGELNVLFLKLLGKFGYVDSGVTLPSTKGVGLVGVLLVVAVLPAFFEELFFRGVLQKELKDLSLIGQALLCGGLFALYHQNPAQTLYQFVCGVAFALVAVKSGSFLPTVLSHFLNNALIILLYALGIEGYPLPLYVALLIVGGLSLVGTFVYLLVFDKQREGVRKGGYKQVFAYASLGLAVFGLSWLAMLIAGF